MKNYKLIIKYDGSRYNGWQIQKETSETIQDKLENILSRMFEKPIEIAGSGRTDAGVHAYAQVANFHIDEKDIIKLQNRNSRAAEYAILKELNTYLPKDIAVLSVEEVDNRFHSRLSAKSKTYVYRINNSDISNVFERKYVYDYPEPLNVDNMQKAALLLEGTHDFKSFCGNPHMKKSTIRTIYSIKIEKTNNEILISYTGNGFLMKMVRIITGTLIEIGDGRRSVESIVSTLNAKNRENAGYTAPPQGLFLKEVFY